jgi:site-specific recombinase XerD
MGGISTYKEKTKEFEELLEVGIITKDEYDKIIGRITKAAANEGESIRTGNLIDSYCNSNRDLLSKSTLNAYVRRIYNFFSWYYKKEYKHDVNDVIYKPFTLADVRKYFEYLSKEGEITSYLNISKSALLSITNYIREIGLPAPDVSTVKIDNRGYNKTLTNAYHIDEIYKIADQSTLRGNVMIRLIFEAGLKRNQILSVKKTISILKSTS